eukprot:Sspe_Gene.4823::Locus_1592_Transcript_2_2_Confidence_0.667_Length_569::g.4823::m.4823
MGDLSGVVLPPPCLAPCSSLPLLDIDTLHVDPSAIQAGVDYDDEPLILPLQMSPRAVSPVWDRLHEEGGMWVRRREAVAELAAHRKEMREVAKCRATPSIGDYPTVPYSRAPRGCHHHAQEEEAYPFSPTLSPHARHTHSLGKKVWSTLHKETFERGRTD